MITIIDVAGDKGISLKRVAGTNDGEYAGPCPACGGEDRARYWPNDPKHKAKGGSYWCRQCGTGGDAIQFLRDHEGLGYYEACERLCLEPNMAPTIRVLQRSTPHLWQPEQRAKTTTAWRDQANLVINRAQQAMGRHQQQYFQNRGLTLESIKKYRLGYLTRTLYSDLEKWGLTEEQISGAKKQWIPSGYVIPHWRDEKPQKLWIRQSSDNKSPKYVLVKGSSTCLSIYSEDHTGNLPIIVVETELDGMLLHQEVGDLAMVMALGSAQGKPDAEAHQLLKKCPLIHVALDCDDAGHKASQFWLSNYPRAKRVVTPSGKDPGEYCQQGGSIRNWVLACMPESLVSMIMNYNQAKSGSK